MQIQKEATGHLLWISLFIALAFPILSLFYLPGLIDSAQIARFFGLSLIGLVVSLWIYIQKIEVSQFFIPDFIILLYGLAYIPSAFYANVSSEAIYETLKTFLFVMAYFLLKAAFETNREYTRKLILQSSFYLTAIILSNVLVQFFVAIQNPGSDSTGTLFVYDIKGSFSHRNILSGYLLLLLPLLLIFLEYEKSMWKRTSAKWLIACVVVVLLVLQSRTIYLALGTGAVIFFVFKNPERRNKKAILLIAGVVCLFLFLSIIARVFLPDSQLKDSIRKLNVLNYYNSASGTERRFLWNNTINMIKDAPVLGVGPGNWKFQFPKYGLGSPAAEHYALDDISAIRPENDFLWIISETGIFSLIFYVAFFVSIIYGLLFVIRKKHSAENEKEALYLLTGIIGYIIFSTFNFPKERVEMQVMLAIYSVITVSLIPVSQKIITANFGRSVWLVFILISIFGIVVGTLRIDGERHVRKMFAAKTYEEWEPTYKESKEAVNQFYEVDHTGLPLSFYSGFSLLQLGKIKEALPELEKAIRIAPYNFHVVNNYGSVLAAMNNYEAAKPYFEQTVKINPRYDNGYYNLSYTSMVLGNFNEARIWLNKVSKNNPARKQAFLQAIQDAELKLKGSNR